jgi:NAD(P)-dependent dehydrogenase (short-subunit alcohol dehydrogenase family)
MCSQWQGDGLMCAEGTRGRAEGGRQRDLLGRAALVTGAASGIGAAVARHLAERGARVLCGDLDEDGARALVDSITATGGAAEAAALDVRDPESVAAAVGTAAGAGALDIAVNSAGIADPAGADILSMSDAAWDAVLAVNLTGVFRCVRAEAAAMSAGGTIVSIASVLGLVGRRNQAAYVASKHGVVGLTKAAAAEFADRGIRVNAVCPGYIETPMIEAMSAEARAPLTSRHAMGRFGTAEEVAEVVGFLASEAGRFVTGAAYTADGGYTAG